MVLKCGFLTLPLQIVCGLGKKRLRTYPEILLKEVWRDLQHLKLIINGIDRSQLGELVFDNEKFQRKIFSNKDGLGAPLMVEE